MPRNQKSFFCPRHRNFAVLLWSITQGISHYLPLSVDAACSINITAATLNLAQMAVDIIYIGNSQAGGVSSRYYIPEIVIGIRGGMICFVYFLNDRCSPSKCIISLDLDDRAAKSFCFCADLAAKQVIPGFGIRLALSRISQVGTPYCPVGTVPNIGLIGRIRSWIGRSICSAKSIICRAGGESVNTCYSQRFAPFRVIGSR
jgi:hypothetical protein